MKEELKGLTEAIVNDYLAWTIRSFDTNGWTHTTPEAKADEFRAGIEIKEGSKYIKILTEKSVWGFVNKGNKDFKVGDLLKAKNWSSPALNKARGNIFEDYSIAWTGPHYLSGYSAGGTRKVELLKPRRAKEGEGCICGEVDCPDAYAHTTSGY